MTRRVLIRGAYLRGMMTLPRQSIRPSRSTVPGGRRTLADLAGDLEPAPGRLDVPRGNPLLHGHDQPPFGELAGQLLLVIVDMLTQLGTARHDDRPATGRERRGDDACASVEDHHCGLSHGGFELGGCHIRRRLRAGYIPLGRTHLRPDRAWECSLSMAPSTISSSRVYGCACVPTAT